MANQFSITFSIFGRSRSPRTPNFQIKIESRRFFTTLRGVKLSMHHTHTAHYTVKKYQRNRNRNQIEAKREHATVAWLLYRLWFWFRYWFCFVFGLKRMRGLQTIFNERSQRTEPGWKPSWPTSLLLLLLLLLLPLLLCFFSAAAATWPLRSRSQKILDT